MAARHHVPITLVDEQIAANSRKLQTLLEDNQQLGADHVALKQELTHTQQELRRLSSAAASVKAERDVQVREVYERSVRVHAESRSIEEARRELERVVKDVVELKGEVEGLAAESERLEKESVEAGRARDEVEEIGREVEAIRNDIVKGSAAIEYEKKIRILNQEQKQAMEKDMITMAREIESLRSELANAEKRSKAAAAAAAAASVAVNPSTVYATSSGNPGMGYMGSYYPDPSNMNQVNSHVNSCLHYGSGAMPNSPFQQTQVHHGSAVMPNGPSQPIQTQFVAEAIPNGSLQQMLGHR